MLLLTSPFGTSLINNLHPSYQHSLKDLPFTVFGKMIKWDQTNYDLDNTNNCSTAENCADLTSKSFRRKFKDGNNKTPPNTPLPHTDNMKNIDKKGTAPKKSSSMGVSPGRNHSFSHSHSSSLGMGGTRLHKEKSNKPLDPNKVDVELFRKYEAFYLKNN